MHRDCKCHRLSRKLRTLLIALREGEGKLHGLPRHHAHQPLLEAFDKAPRADGKLRSRIASVLKGHTVLFALIVNGHRIPFGHCPIGDAAVVLGHIAEIDRIKKLVALLFVHLSRRCGNFKAAIVAQRDILVHRHIL